MKSSAQHLFSIIPDAQIPRSVFDRSHCHKTTFNEGYLIPFCIDEVMPGDTFRVRASIFCRLATPIVPIMDNISLDTHWFFVPERIIWNHFRNHMGEKANESDTTQYLVPVLSSYTVAEGDLYNHFGLPIGVQAHATRNPISALPGRAYLACWNEWFRDQSQQNPVAFSLDDGPDSGSGYALQIRNKKHDYFTSALPWPQRPSADYPNGVYLPLGTSAPVIGDGKAIGLTTGVNNFGLVHKPIGVAEYGIWASSGAYNVNVGTSASPNTSGTAEKAIGLQTDKTKSGLIADLASASAVTLNTLRQAFQVQRLLERDARGGARYRELVKAHFKVDFPDLLYRPEYLGGSSSRINVHPVQQTSASPTSPDSSHTPQGNLAAFAVGSDQTGFTKSFNEHGFILGLVSVRADNTYQSGVPRMFTRRTREDRYWPAFAYLGEQSIYNREVFAANTDADANVWGYQERWAEYRYKPSVISGAFSSFAAAPLDVWHLAQKFNSLPALSTDFIQCDHGQVGSAFNRVVAITSQPHFIFDSYIEMHCARPMPTYSVPGLIDHF